MFKKDSTPSVRKKEPVSDTQLLMTITICIFFGMYILAMLVWGGGFLKPQQLFDMLNENAYLIIISLGLTIVMVTGSIDISVGGIVALVVMVDVMILNGSFGFVTAIQDALGAGDWIRILIAAIISILIGLAFGVVQGLLVAYLQIQPFIVTLAGMFFARGMVTIISVDPQKAPQNLMDILQSRIEMPLLGSVNKKGINIPAKMEIGVIIALVLVVVTYILLKKFRSGRAFYAVGGNQQSALMLGVNVKKTRFRAHILCGLLAGIAGMVFMMHTGAGNATNATASEMNAIASSIIGGTLLTGGVGNIIGTFFGTMTLVLIKSIVIASGLRDPWWQSITVGALLCFFILLQSVVLSKRGKGGFKTPAFMKSTKSKDK